MIRLVYSNRMEELLADLAARVRAEQTAAGGALTPVRVVVPSAAIDRHVRLGIARERGIAANLEVIRLPRFVAQVATPQGARIADADALEALLLTVLFDAALLAQPSMAPVRAYLFAGGEAPDIVDVRRVQLAARLARIFEEYTHSRGDLLAAWARGTTLEGGGGEQEAWQRGLWLAVFGPDGVARHRAPPVVPLHEAVGTMEPRALGRSAHVFGFAHLPRAVHEVFQRLARSSDLLLYVLSPCEGFWEDLDRNDPAPLRDWGRAGREQVRTLNVLAGFDHEDRFVDPLQGDAPDTLLHRIQSDILRREPLPAGGSRRPSFDHDSSVVVLEHAGIRRELESVASEIWQLVSDDETLRFDDIALLVPAGDAAAYAVHLPAVFHEAHDLPHQTLAVTGPQSSRVAEAIDLLLSLPLGRCTRPEVLRLAMHPNVAAGMEGSDPSRWLAWSEALGVVHGADRADHAGTYIDTDILNWDQGLRRLALGVFMSGDASGERTPWRVGEDAYVPHEVAGSDIREAASFCLLIRSLLADARFAGKESMTTRRWAEFLRAMVETYVTPTSDREADDLARCLRRLHSLRDVDLGAQAVSYRVASQLALARVSAGDVRRGGEGVLVSTLAAVRPLPFRHVFACGMGEGRFPAPEAEDPLDLRWARRREGDVTARDRDKYAFLELLLGTRERLYLSYVSRDPLTGDALAPSSVVQELLQTIGERYAVDPAALRRRQPLRRWDPRYFPDLFASHGTPPGSMSAPEARAEARTLALRQSIRRAGASVDAAEVQARAQQDPAWAGLVDHLRLASLPAAAPRIDARVVVPMFALVKFLEFPLQGWARFRLGLDEIDEDDVLARDAEPFETHIREETLLLRDVFLAAASQRRPLEDAYDATVRERELRGRGPSGVFARGERGEHLQALVSWKAALEASGVAHESLELHRFGRAGEHARAHHVHDRLVLDVDVDEGGVTRILQVEISGRTLPLGASGAASVTLSKRAHEATDPWSAAGRRRLALRAFVDHAVMAASGLGGEGAHRSLAIIATRERVITDAVEFAPLTRDAATAWLRRLVRDLLGGQHAYFLPCEAVFVHRQRDAAAPLGPVLEEARDKLRGDGPPALRSAYGPVPRPQEYPAPAEDTAREMVDRRFGAVLGDQGERRGSP